MKKLVTGKYHIHVVLCLFVGMAVLLADQLQATNYNSLVTLEGTTQEWQGGDKYVELPRVQVVVTRNGRLVDSTASARDGSYKMTMRQGEPIHVVYHLSKQYLPEMQSLSGAASVTHQVSPSLMTLEQYQQLQQLSEGKLPPLSERLSCVSKYVPRESKIFKDINAMMREYAPNF